MFYLIQKYSAPRIGKTFVQVFFYLYGTRKTLTCVMPFSHNTDRLGLETWHSKKERKRALSTWS